MGTEPVSVWPTATRIVGRAARRSHLAEHERGSALLAGERRPRFRHLRLDALLQEIQRELFHYYLDVASGRKKAWTEVHRIHNDLALFNPAPLT